MSTKKYREISERLNRECSEDLYNLLVGVIGEDPKLEEGEGYFYMSWNWGRITKLRMRKSVFKILGDENLLKLLQDFFIPEYPVDGIYFEDSTPNKGKSRPEEFRSAFIQLKDLPLGWDAYYNLKEGEDLFK
jgi:hypothetical protein